MRRALLPLLLISSLGVVGFRGQEPAVAAPQTVSGDTYSLVHKRVLGESQTVEMKVEGKFGEAQFVSTVTISQKITELADDGAYSAEVTTSDAKTTLNGEEVPIEDTGEPKTKTQKYDAKGNRVLASGEEESDNGPIDVAFEYEPKSPVKIGDTWTPTKDKEDDPEPIEWTLVGKEQLDGKDVLIVEGKGKGADGETIESKIWMDPATFIARKATSTIRGIKQEEGAEGEMTISIQEKA